MALCRFGNDSDVYMYERDSEIVCCGCLIADVEASEFIYYRDAVAHLIKHLSWDHKVPEGVIAGLEDYIEQYGNSVRS